MAYNVYRNRNPFEDEEDDNFEDISDTPELVRIKQEQELYQQRMIDSSYRSLQMINESQGIASETAEELHKQREQLEHTNKNLDKMNGELDQSERSITSLKSIWGTIGNWFKKPVETTNEPSSTEAIKGDAAKINKDIRKENTEIQNNMRKIDHSTNLAWENSSDVRGRKSTDDVVDKNLGQMLAGLEVLKHQGLSLGKEIDDHNELLDTIQRKVDDSDVRIEDQNLKIRKILK